MKHIRMYEEYKYFKSPIGNYVNYKDPNEPFWISNKQSYFGNIRREVERQERDIRVRRQTEEKRILLENVIKPLVNESTDIIKNHPERIKKTKYDGKENMMGVLLDNGTSVVVVFYHDFSIRRVMINKIEIPFYKVNIVRRDDIDPLGEEDWNENEVSPTKVLGDLVINYIKQNEVIW